MSNVQSLRSQIRNKIHSRVGGSVWGLVAICSAPASGSRGWVESVGPVGQERPMAEMPLATLGNQPGQRVKGEIQWLW